jgi:LmbE family N-acetylglucosaminyl deacetylase
MNPMSPGYKLVTIEPLFPLHGSSSATLPPSMRTARLLFVGLLLLGVTPVEAQRPWPAEPMNAAELKLAIDKLDVLASALYVAAHPDDENTAMLAWLSSGRRAETTYLSITRGSGGQNLIGSETGDLLGVIRTEELLAARELDGAGQRFTRAIDFGYTKSPEETLAVWDEEAALADVVRVIRERRPDVIINRFPTDGRGGHGQHTASAILAERAFDAAGDPSRFPEQLDSLEPWQPRRLLWNVWGDPDPGGTETAVGIGGYNPLLGTSYGEIAARSRSMHKSQGFGAAGRRGGFENRLQLIRGDAPQDNDLFSGIDTSWSRVEGGEAVSRLIGRARSEFDLDRPERSLPGLLAIRDAMELLPADWWIETKREELKRIIASTAGLWIEAIAPQAEVSPGSSLPIRVGVVQRAGKPASSIRIRTPWAAETVIDSSLTIDEMVSTDLQLTIPADAPLTQPYWLQQEHDGRMHDVHDTSLVTLPVGPPAVPVEVALSIDGREISWTTPLLYRWTDRIRGELYREVEIVPPVTLELRPSLLVFPSAEPRTLSVTVRAKDDVGGTLRFEHPESWSVRPAITTLDLGAGAEHQIDVEIVPPEEDAEVSIGALFVTDSGEMHRLERRLIDYEHIPPQTVHQHSRVRSVRADIAHRGHRVGYVMGSGDEVPAALRQMGYEVIELSDDDLSRSDLSRYDAIVFGIRAFNTRDLDGARMERVLDYVRNGGVAVAQYNTSGWREETTIPAPHPFRISSDRVTDETAPVRLLQPEHPLLSSPNRITALDFEGWVQERGLYFPGTWDERWETVIATADPGEDLLEGGLLYTTLGDGVFIYTGYSFFRQLPAGVPGAWRLFANLVSGGRE